MAEQADSVSVFGAGNALLDISCEVDQAFFEKYGIESGNAILAEEKHMPMYAELAAMDGVQYIPGGATLNSIRVCQWMMKGGETGGTTGYVSCISNDDFGTRLKNGCTKEGVKTSFDTSTEPTGTCAVAIQGGERSLVANLSAANKYQMAHLKTDEAKALWGNADTVYCAGFWLTVCADGMTHIGQHCKDTGKRFCINISAPFIAQFFNPQMESLFPYITTIFGNETEAVELGKARNYNTTDVAEIAQKLSQEGNMRVVFTQGADPTIVVENGKVQTFDVPKLDQSLIVDTNGAGDSFVGGFLAAEAAGKSLATCVAWGNYAARIIIQTSGCQLSAAAAPPADVVES